MALIIINGTFFLKKKSFMFNKFLLGFFVVSYSCFIFGMEETINSDRYLSLPPEAHTIVQVDTMKWKTKEIFIGQAMQRFWWGESKSRVVAQEFSTDRGNGFGILMSSGQNGEDVAHQLIQEKHGLIPAAVASLKETSNVFLSLKEAFIDYNEKYFVSKFKHNHQRTISFRYEPLKFINVGACATLALLYPDHEAILIAHVGDNQIVKGDLITGRCRQLTKNHCPHNPFEMERLLKTGNTVNKWYGWRLNYSFVVSRAFGNTPFNAGLIVEPDVLTVDLKESDFLLMASNGFWSNFPMCIVDYRPMVHATVIDNQKKFQQLMQAIPDICSLDLIYQNFFATMIGHALSDWKRLLLFNSHKRKVATYIIKKVIEKKEKSAEGVQFALLALMYAAIIKAELNLKVLLETEDLTSLQNKVYNNRYFLKNSQALQLIMQIPPL
jgi:serine/threonine protein phosphatase PrpC